MHSWLRQTGAAVTSFAFADMHPSLHLQLMNNLDFKAAIGELTQAVNYLKESGSKKVGVVGFW